MKPPTIVSVTQEHIDRGEPYEADKCPVALAICEQWAQERAQASVWVEAIVSVPTGDSWTAKLPKLAFDWVQNFDSGRPVEPIAIALNWRRSS